MAAWYRGKIVTPLGISLSSYFVNFESPLYAMIWGPFWHVWGQQKLRYPKLNLQDVLSGSRLLELGACEARGEHPRGGAARKRQDTDHGAAKTEICQGLSWAKPRCDSDDDGNESCSASNGQLQRHVVGRWWFGKNTVELRCALSFERSWSLAACPIIAQMPGTWDRYYADADGVIFVVDAADLSNLPRAGSVLGASRR